MAARCCTRTLGGAGINSMSISAEVVSMRSASLVLAVLACGACAGDATGSKSGRTYSAPYASEVVESTVSTSLTGGGTFPCTNTYAMNGTLTITIDESSGAMVGSAQIA